MIPNNFPTGTGSNVETIDWIVQEPTVSYKRAVVILYGSDGLAQKWQPEIERHAKALADAGILALIPDYFKKSPAVAHDNSVVVFAQAQSRQAEWAQVCRDAVTAAQALPNIDPARVGLIGFSLGGYLALQIRDAVPVLVEYFAPFFNGIGGNVNSTLKAHIHHGDADELVPLSLNAKPIEDALTSQGATVSHIYFPGANHGFLGNDPPNTAARARSLQVTTQFIDTNL